MKVDNKKYFAEYSKSIGNQIPDLISNFDFSENSGELVGVQKAQISKIENNAKDVRFSTIMKVFSALKATVKMSINFNSHSHLEIA